MTNSTETKKGCLGIDKDNIEPLSSWVNLVAAFMMMMIGLALPDVSFGIFYNYFMERYDVSRATVGWVLSTYQVTGCVCGRTCACTIISFEEFF